MCGILGAAACNMLDDTSWMKEGILQLRHRGPDASGVWSSSDGKVSFRHQRLSIIDLDEKANQPMTFAEGRYCIVFNGEIYNYKNLKQELASYGTKFITKSDTEVLLQAYLHWGTDCVNHLNGMFSFAISDRNTNQVFLARDRVGEKPLFYWHNQGKLYFASELKALFANTRITNRISPQSLECYLAFGYIPHDLCIIDGYSKLPAGHTMIFNLKTGSINIRRYWNIPDFNEANRISQKDLLDELEFLLEDAVKIQLESDVPVGILLSGGIDSSLITAFAKRTANQLKTFTIRIPGSNSLDESKHARLISDFFDTEHVELDASEPNIELLQKLAKVFDEPMNDSSMIPTFLVSELIKGHCSVALGGDGGDELFGGYHHYNRLLKAQKYFGLVPHFLRKKLGAAARQTLPLGFRGRNYIEALSIDFTRGIPLMNTLFDYENRRRLVPSLESNFKTAEEIIGDNMQNYEDLLQRATRTDFKNYLAEDILVKIDRTSMANSLEMRSPMLDYRIVELAFSKIPSSLKAGIVDRKIILKKLTEKLLPKEFESNRKQGFSVPLSNWLSTGKSRKFFVDVLTDESCMFDRSATEKLIKGIDQGRSNSERLFALVMIELWKNEYQVQL